MISASVGISFVVPVYNEEGAVRQTLERLDATLRQIGLPYEIIVVDDGSRDASASIAASVQGVQVVRHLTNCGYGAALKTGIRHASREWVGIVDADGTYPIERLPDLVAKMREGFDMVVAKRENVLELDGVAKRIFRKTFIRLINALLNRKVDDPNSGFRMFKRDLALYFMPFLCDKFSFTTSISIFFFGDGLFVTYLPIEYSERTGRSKVSHLRDTLRTGQLVMQGVMHSNPVKFAMIMALAVVVAGALPAGLLMLAGAETAGWLYFATVVMVDLVFSLGLFFDVLRITMIRSLRAGRTPAPVPMLMDAVEPAAD